MTGQKPHMECVSSKANYATSKTFLKTFSKPKKTKKMVERAEKCRPLKV